jgi:hypothetical protein
MQTPAVICLKVCMLYMTMCITARDGKSHPSSLSHFEHGLGRSCRGGKTIVFFSTKHSAHRAKILFGLGQLPPAAELHGNMTQAARLESLERFRKVCSSVWPVLVMSIYVHVQDMLPVPSHRVDLCCSFGEASPGILHLYRPDLSATCQTLAWAWPGLYYMA